VSQFVFQGSAWYRAATLVERIAGRPAHVRSDRNAGREAERRLLRWRSQPPFTNAAVFAQRLALDGITEAEFLRLLGEPLDSLRAGFPRPMPWLVELREALSDGYSRRAIPFPVGTGEQVSALLASVQPLIAHCLDQLHKGVQHLLLLQPAAPVDSQTIERILFADLPEQLFSMLGRTLVLELNVARLEGLLGGETPEDRFCSFSQRVRQPEIALLMLREYPVLARQLTIRLSRWVAFALEFLERLCTDWDLIRRTLSPDQDPGILVHVQTDAGDRHRRGRSVLIAKFSSGLGLVYKPKSMAVDRHFQEILTWTNQRSGDPGFRTLTILDRDTYGWAEFAAAEPCASLPALRRFYERQGAYLALLYVLEATDFHNENVIAAGEHPVLIDLEALFHPQRMVPQADQEEIDKTAIDHSVLRVGLLPQRDWSSAESDGVDFSGLGGAAGQITPYGVPDWDKPGTDEMRLTRKRVAMPVANNRPSLNGNEVNPADYVAEILTGFTRLYRLLHEHREELLSASGPLTRFAADQVRVVLRPTQTYGLLLAESFHPDLLRDALDRDQHFDRLWVAVEPLPYLAKVVQAERADLQHGDIPIFTTEPCSRDLWTSSGQRIKDFFDESALAVVQRRVRQLSERDLELQRWMIRASLATSVGSGDWEQRRAHTGNGSPRAVDHDQLVRAARTVGDRLESLAIRANGRASWIGLVLEREGQWSVAPLGIDLYDGLLGVTLFLAHLGAMTGELRYTDLAREACAAVLRRADHCKSSVTAIGAFDGWGGILYALAHLGALWRAPDLLAKAEDVVRVLRTWVERDQHFDIITGAAGCIGALLALHRYLPSPGTLAAAIECGDHLIAHAQPAVQGLGWTLPNEVTPLSGFAHGAAGIAWALLKLTALTGEERFRTTALAALGHERSLFSPQARNWRDLRVPVPNEDSFMHAWCNGAPGIGLARLSTIDQLDGPEIRREIDIAVQTTLDQGFGRSHSLCHGDLGNLELLLQAGQVLDNERWGAEAYRLASPIVERVSTREYRCGTPLHVVSPGLMTGLAGIGYGLLRLAGPARVPSVLTLEPPRQDSTHDMTISACASTAVAALKDRCETQ